MRATETALAELLAADLAGLDLAAVMIDGVHFADHLCVVALGIDILGVKHPLALVEGSTENATLVRSLLVGLRERVWTSPARRYSSPMVPRRCALECWRCSTIRSSPGVSYTRSEMSRIICWLAARIFEVTVVHRRHRIDDRDLPRPFIEREALA